MGHYPERGCPNLSTNLEAIQNQSVNVLSAQFAKIHMLPSKEIKENAICLLDLENMLSMMILVYPVHFTQAV